MEETRVACLFNSVEARVLSAWWRVSIDASVHAGAVGCVTCWIQPVMLWTFRQNGSRRPFSLFCAALLVKKSSVENSCPKKFPEVCVQVGWLSTVVLDSSSPQRLQGSSGHERSGEKVSVCCPELQSDWGIIKLSSYRYSRLSSLPVQSYFKFPFVTLDKFSFLLNFHSGFTLARVAVFIVELSWFLLSIQ